MFFFLLCLTRCVFHSVVFNDICFSFCCAVLVLLEVSLNNLKPMCNLFGSELNADWMRKAVS